MKRVIFAAMMAAFVAGSAAAQQQPAPQPQTATPAQPTATGGQTQRATPADVPTGR